MMCTVKPFYKHYFARIDKWDDKIANNFLELGIKVNNYKVLEEYRRRHPEEMKPTKQTEVKDGQEI